MARQYNHRIEVRVGAFGTTACNKIKEKLMNAGLCITYTGTTVDNTIWVEGKVDHLKSVMGRFELDIVTELQLVPLCKPVPGNDYR